MIRERLKHYYEESMQNICAEICNLLDFYDGATDCEKRVGGFFLNLAKYGCSFKHRAFVDEREWRAALFEPRRNFEPTYRSGRSTLIPYTAIPLVQEEKLSIEKIVVGPTADEQVTKRSIEGYIKTLNCSKNRRFHIDCGEITTSKLPFRQM